jgi:hypothetical protein
MKKSYLNIIRFGLLCAVALLFSVSAETGFAAAAAKSTGDAQLVITRSPKLGTNTFFSVFVDGKKMDSIGNGKRYAAPLTAGKHTVMVRYEPLSAGEKPASIDLNVAGGQTYIFTATIQHGDITLLKMK